MTQGHRILLDEIVKLPVEKIGKVISFVRYLEQEAETELVLDSTEEIELYELIASGDFVDASEVLDKIKELPDD